MDPVTLNLGGDFAKLLEDYFLKPLKRLLIWVFYKSKPLMISCAKSISLCCWKSYAHVSEFVKERRSPGQREKANRELIELAHRFMRCKPFLALSNNRLWWCRLFDRDHEDEFFQDAILSLEEAGLIEIPNGAVKDSQLTRLGCRVAYVIWHHGIIPPVWYPTHRHNRHTGTSL